MSSYVPLKYKVLFFIGNLGEGFSTREAIHKQFSSSFSARTINVVLDRLLYEDEYLTDTRGVFSLLEDGRLFIESCQNDSTLIQEASKFKTRVLLGGREVAGPVGPRFIPSDIINAALPKNKKYKSLNDHLPVGQIDYKIKSTASALGLSVDEFAILVAGGAVKECTVCHEYKSLGEYHKDKYKSDGKCVACKQCKNSLYRKKTLDKGEN